ncbi:hypothetical protein VTJ04DRAFT_7462 [Mycothermus thermophilus]|uniref:uncharacterized protein n=1 Tax=Humicola insolens TaxID=85995 RepID=UPI0037432130
MRERINMRRVLGYSTAMGPKGSRFDGQGLSLVCQDRNPGAGVQFWPQRKSARISSSVPTGGASKSETG